MILHIYYDIKYMRMMMIMLSLEKCHFLELFKKCSGTCSSGRVKF